MREDIADYDGTVTCKNGDHPKDVDREVPTWFAVYGAIETIVGGVAQRGAIPRGWQCAICCRGFPFAPLVGETEAAYIVRYTQYKNTHG